MVLAWPMWHISVVKLIVNPEKITPQTSLVQVAFYVDYENRMPQISSFGEFGKISKISHIPV